LHIKTWVSWKDDIFVGIFWVNEMTGASLVKGQVIRFGAVATEEMLNEKGKGKADMILCGDKISLN